MKKVFEVHIPYPQTLVYFIEAETSEQAIEIAKTAGIVEDHSIGGMAQEEKAFIREDFKVSKENGQ